MMWDFAENNVFGDVAGDYMVSLRNMAKALDNMPARGHGVGIQQSAQAQSVGSDKLISTDPPYYDNIGYADLSDFFYVWLRRSLKPVFPELFATLAVPKAEGLVATPYRHGSKEAAEAFFLEAPGIVFVADRRRGSPVSPVRRGHRVVQPPSGLESVYPERDSGCIGDIYG